MNEPLPEVLVLPKTEKPIPLPNDLPSVVSLESDMLPDCIRDYVFDVADRQQCPPDFVAVAALCGLSACIGNKLSVAPKQSDDWQVVPNLWGAIIGRPSAMKSPAMKAALEPMRAIESSGREHYQQSLEAYRAEVAIAEIGEKIGKEDAKKLLKKGNREEALAAVCGDLMPEEPTRPRLIVNDATIEKLGELLNENPSGLMLERDELSGWLAKLRGEQGQSDRAFYLQCFDGNGSFVYDRIGRGTIEIEQTTLSIIGAIQPARLAPLVRGAVRGNDDDGLIQRLQLGVWPVGNTTWKWRDRKPNKVAKDKYNQVFQKFNAMERRDNPYRLSTQAQGVFIEWMTELQNEARSGKHHSALESYMLKMPQTVTSIALIFELISQNNGTISEQSVRKALDWADYLQSHARRIYGLATDGGVSAARLLLKRREKLDTEFSARKVQRKGWTGLITREDVEEALVLLVDYHHLSETINYDTGGRPAVSYRWNEE